MPNDFAGVGAGNVSNGSQIGGASGASPGSPCAFPCNLISGNAGFGVAIGTGGSSIGQADDVIQGNCIGTQVDCVTPLPNGSDGINLGLSPANTTIGGTGAGEGNVIAHNLGHGILVGTGVENHIRRNSIFQNQGLGIDLGGEGVTPNDPGDPDSGANFLQNFPIITSVEPALAAGPQGASTRIQGFIRGTASTQLELDFFSNDSCADRPQEFLEGALYLGSSSVTTDGTGFAAIDVTLPVDVAANDPVSATATDSDGNTSEFSQRLPLFVFPTSGTPAGGTNLSITGTDFQAGATVTIGGVAAGNVVFNNSNSISATSPLLPAGTVNDLTVANPDGSEGTLPKAWVADFLDVPFSNNFYSFVTTLVRNAITVGIGGGLYGVNDNTLRQQMAVFLLKAKFGLCYTPPPCAGVFTDVPCSSSFAPWIEALSALGITGGCGTNVYCPQNPVRRDQMAVFLLKAKYGLAYTPPPCTGVFPDVACPSQFADWIEQLAEEDITTGCGGNNYCPLNPNTRGQMAVFVEERSACNRSSSHAHARPARRRHGRRRVRPRRHDHGDEHGRQRRRVASAGDSRLERLRRSPRHDRVRHSGRGSAHDHGRDLARHRDRPRDHRRDDAARLRRYSPDRADGGSPGQLGLPHRRRRNHDPGSGDQPLRNGGVHADERREHGRGLPHRNERGRDRGRRQQRRHPHPELRRQHDRGKHGRRPQRHLDRRRQRDSGQQLGRNDHPGQLHRHRRHGHWSSSATAEASRSHSRRTRGSAAGEAAIATSSRGPPATA